MRLANGIGAGRAEDCDAALADLLAYVLEQDGEAAPAPDAPEFERPPSMRDLRIRPVQRLGAAAEE